MIFMAAAALALGICHADVKDVKVLGTSHQELGYHAKVTSITFSDGKMTVHAPEGDGVYNLSDVSDMTVSKTPTGLLPDVTSQTDMDVILRDGVLSLSSATEIRKVEVYTATGIRLAAGTFSQNEVTLTVATDYPVLIVKAETAGTNNVIKIVNR